MNLGVIDMIDDMNIKAKTMSNATPQLRGILPEMVKTVVMAIPNMAVNVKVAGSGSILSWLLLLASRDGFATLRVFLT